MKIVAKIVHYGARTLAVLFAAFLSLFILEGFGPDFGWEASVGHAILAAFAVVLAVLAFKRPFMGGLVYAALGLAFMLRTLVAILTTAAPGPGPSPDLFALTNPVGWFLIIIGAVFLLDAWFIKLRKKSAS